MTGLGEIPRVELEARLLAAERERDRVRAIVEEMGDGVSPECSGFADKLRRALGDQVAPTEPTAVDVEPLRRIIERARGVQVTHPWTDADYAVQALIAEATALCDTLAAPQVAPEPQTLGWNGPPVAFPITPGPGEPPQVAPEPLPERTDAERLADLNALRAVEGNRPLDALPPESSWADADRVTFPQVAPEPERCHTVTVAFEDGWTTVQMTCPFDRADKSRPCWPRDDHGEPEPAPQDFCNWKEWFDSSGGAESMREHTLGTWPVESEWDGEAMWFSVVAAAAPQGEPEPREPCAKCGYAGGCMEPWAAVSLDDPSDKVLIPCGTCPPCRASAPQGEPEPPKGAA